ncbi:glycosyltransferase family protein [Marilutibacter chinensis]|uniref:Glycosyltransferase n=1 Tax=Marilutibacter chinensis TaxID=2912247 RepID=A0ABS9HRM6_9GAMM|nr:glycosyltransferase [Lysobacter chinensis]MCF7221318.1 glycosyltransferase [Lysobacter chinensis]
MSQEEQPGHASSAVETVRRREDRTQLDVLHKRTQELVAQTRELDQVQRRLKRELEEASVRADRAEDMLRWAVQLVQSMESGFEQLRKSASMQLGYTVMEAARSWRSLLKAPVRIARIIARGRSGADPERQQQVVDVAVPHEWFPLALRMELERFHARLGPASNGVAGAGMEKSIGAVRGMSGHAARMPEKVSGLRIAAIMDEFTFAAFRECCDLQQLHPDTFKSEIDSFNPHMLFVESAWHGRDGAWERQVSNASGKLLELTEYCRTIGVPVAFWSKEDPVHFRTFLRTAALADCVFTTDIDCIKHYKRELGHDRVYLLPFATEQRSHNPVEKYSRIDKLCFAGSYYRRYPMRQRDFDALVRASEELGGLDIYDRNHGKEHPNYTFPERYQELILGGLSFDQIDIAYKGYEYGLNINTVKRSQSMFARRVFDLAASGTITVSNYARGLRLLFGDLVVSSDDSAEIVRRLKPLREDPVLRRKMKLAALRKVMREHTYERRLQYLARKVLSYQPMLGRVRITAIAMAGNEMELDKAVRDFRLQEYPHKTLAVVIRRGFTPRRSPSGDGIRLFSEGEATDISLHSLAPDGFLALLHANDHYDPAYLGDLADAAFYSGESAIGKAAHFEYVDGQVRMCADGAQYMLGQSIALRSGICKASELREVMLLGGVTTLADAPLPFPGLGIDEFSYCMNGAARAEVAEAVSAHLDVDPGVSIEALLARAESIRVDGSQSPVALEGVAGLGGMKGVDIAKALGTPANKYLRASESDGACLVTSSLPVGKHAYAYLKGDYAPQELGITDIVRMQLVVEQGSSAVELVLVYLDASGKKISHHILKSAMNVTATLPEGVARVRIGFRFSKPGAIAIRKIAYDHVPLAVDELLSTGRYLVLAKNYPSYDDLYKHAFVHRRVVEYRNRGVDVDVFRIGSEGLDYYEFEGVDVVHGESGHLRAMLEGGHHEAILVHFLDERMWEVLRDFVDSKRIYVWAHGAEIQSASRRQFDHHDDAQRDRARRLGERRMKFWKGLLEDPHPNLKLVFVSEWFARDVMDDIGVEIPRGTYEVIHNFIDTDLFGYAEKDAEARGRVLSIRPYESAKYANDLSVQAVLKLREFPEFEHMRFCFMGDGTLFDETLAPLRDLPNVSIERRFLTQTQIAALHREYGLFLCPTRMDAQGVSRDEAMASGLVPVTNAVTAIPEFVDERCGVLAGADDADGLAAGMLALYRDPERFMRLSKAASQRVRTQSGFDQTIAREIALFSGKYEGASV